MTTNGYTLVRMDEQMMIYAMIGIIAVLCVWVIWLEIRLGRIFRGKRAESLEHVLIDMGKFMDELDATHRKIETRMEEMNGRVKRSIQGVETVRFNPFPDAGGNQSFATALLNEHGDGVVISSLYSRDNVSVYSKPVKSYQSDFQLTKEERDAIERARS